MAAPRRSTAATALALVAFWALGAGVLGLEEDGLLAEVEDASATGSHREARIVRGQNDTQEAHAEAVLAARPKKPNIVIIILDDVGWGDLGVYGGGVTVGSATPNMDALAAGGLKLTSTYSQPTCTPSRAALLTGRLPMRTGLLRPPMSGEKGGISREKLLPQLIKDKGYRTAAVGKWHLGENEASRPANFFDKFLGFLGVSNMYTEWRDVRIHPEIVRKQGRMQFAEQLVGNTRLVRNVAATDGGNATFEELVDITPEVLSTLDRGTFLNYSTAFINEAAEADEPFLLYHATSGCHFDNYPEEGVWAGSSAAAYPYRDCIASMDSVVGSLMMTLREAGVENNTLVFLTSDNGPELETWPDSGHTPFRGGKGSTWEGGVRVPGIMHWPGVIEAGRVSDGLFDFTDVLPTVLRLAGASDALPTDRFIDGVDQTSFLLAATNETHGGGSNRKFVYMWLMSTLSAVRVAEYKFMSAATYWEFMRDSANPGGLSGDITRFLTGKLFNLYVDAKESHDFLIRNTPFLSVFQRALAEHVSTFTRYPARKLVSMVSSDDIPYENTTATEDE